MQDVEERAEDTIAALVKQGVSNARVFAAWEHQGLEYPAVVIHAGSSEPLVEDAESHEHRTLGVEVACIVEAAPEMNTAGTVLRETRAINRQLRSDVLMILRVPDLAARLNEMNMPGVMFSMAEVGRTERSTEDLHLITTIELECIAHPTELE